MPFGPLQPVRSALPALHCQSSNITAHLHEPGVVLEQGAPVLQLGYGGLDHAPHFSLRLVTVRVRLPAANQEGCQARSDCVCQNKCILVQSNAGTPVSDQAGDSMQGDASLDSCVNSCIQERCKMVHGTPAVLAHRGCAATAIPEVTGVRSTHQRRQ